MRLHKCLNGTRSKRSRHLKKWNCRKPSWFCFSAWQITVFLARLQEAGANTGTKPRESPCSGNMLRNVHIDKTPTSWVLVPDSLHLYVFWFVPTFPLEMQQVSQMQWCRQSVSGTSLHKVTLHQAWLPATIQAGWVPSATLCSFPGHTTTDSHLHPTENTALCHAEANWENTHSNGLGALVYSGHGGGWAQVWCKMTLAHTGAASPSPQGRKLVRLPGRLLTVDEAIKARRSSYRVQEEIYPENISTWKPLWEFTDATVWQCWCITLGD